MKLEKSKEENPPQITTSSPPPPPSISSLDVPPLSQAQTQQQQNIEQSLRLILKLRNNSDITLSEYNMLKDIITNYSELYLFNNMQLLQLNSLLNPTKLSTPTSRFIVTQTPVKKEPEPESPSKFLFKAGDNKIMKDETESPAVTKSFHSVQQLNPQASIFLCNFFLEMSKEEMDKARRERIEKLDKEAKERAQKAAQDKKISSLIDKYTEAYQIKK